MRNTLAKTLGTELKRLVAFAQMLGIALVGYFVLGILGQQLSILYLRLTPEVDGWGWALYVIGLALALASPILAKTLSARGPVHWTVRATLVTFPLFFCPQLLVGGTPDWDLRPLILGFVWCRAASLAAYRVTRGGDSRPAAVRAA